MCSTPLYRYVSYLLVREMCSVSHLPKADHCAHKQNIQHMYKSIFSCILTVRLVQVRLRTVETHLSNVLGSPIIRSHFTLHRHPVDRLVVTSCHEKVVESTSTHRGLQMLSGSGGQRRWPLPRGLKCIELGGRWPVWALSAVVLAALVAPTTPAISARLDASSTSPAGLYAVSKNF